MNHTVFDERITCLGCGYRLANLPGHVCPECGRWFNPRDATTFRGPHLSTGWRRWAKPPTLLENTVVATISAYGILGASGPAQWEAGHICFVGIVGVPLWIGIAVVYLNRALACIRDATRAELDHNKQVHQRRWAVTPVCTLLIISTFIYPWPMMLRFRLSQTAFETALKDYLAGRFPGSSWVGLFHVDHVHEITYFNGRTRSIGFVTGSSIGDPVGFAYDPQPNHPMGYNAVCVAPSWYSYED